MDLDRVESILGGAGTRAAADRLQVDVILARRRIRAAEDPRRVRPVGRRRHPRRERGRQRAQDEVGHALARLRPPRDRRGRPRVHERALGRRDVDRPVEAAVGRDLRVQHRLQDEREIDDVDVAGDLRAGAGEVQRDPVARHREADPQRHRRPADAVVVHPVLEGVHAVGNAANRRPDPALAVGERGVHRGDARVPAIALHELLQASGPEPIRGELRAEVGAPLPGEAEVEQDQLHHVLAKATALDDPDRRDAQPLVPDAVRLTARAVGVVGDVGHESDGVAVGEHR